ncbi:MAG: M23 family metallopeptidase [Balneolales bacterium]|nr:M23 family metallopeptidase [Balneolales bacterium]
MSLKNHYYYDEETCEFIPIEYKRREQIVYNLAIWILNGVVLAGLGIIILSTKIGTPAELALEAENRALYEQLESTRSSIIDLDSKLRQIAELDNEMYRSILGMEPIPYDEREAGAGGTDPYEHFDIYNESTSALLRWTAENLDNLERQIGIQSLSFEELKNQYNNNSEAMRHIPAIKPTSGIMLSGFGMRYHPILGYNRPHNGLDFRADIGAPVYATADGVIKTASRQGTLGRIVLIDHGYGYETLYAHLSAYEDGIRAGTEVKRGQQIGKAGDSGLSEGPHLHYEIRFNGRYVDPKFYLFADTSPEEYLLFKEIAETNTKSF